IFLLLTTLMVFLSCVSENNRNYSGEYPVELTLTSGNRAYLMESIPGLGFSDRGGKADVIIQIEEEQQFQTMQGFGASLTDASSWLIYNHPQRDEIMTMLFSKEEGIGINYLRQPLGASDYSLTWYTYDDVPGDENLEHFSIAHDEEYIIPLLQQALEINPDLKIMGTPWSPPGWMKEGQKYGELDLIQGFLNKDYYSLYADYLVKALLAYREHGIEFDGLTVQNEPLNFSATWPSMYMSSDAQRSFLTYLIPKLEENNLDPKILLFDHNWDNPAYPRDVLDFMAPEMMDHVYGAAFHGYNGSAEGQSLFKNDYPEMGVFFTELTGGKWSHAFNANLIWNYKYLFIPATRNWAETIILWNLALDKEGGPNIRQPASTPWDICRGVLTLDIENNQVFKEVEYYVIGQMSRFVLPGAVRIQSSQNDSLLTVAFINPDGSKVLVVLNKDPEYREMEIQWQNKYLSYTMPPVSVGTFVWE
nr:hypothetical protein [Spirochaetaceae bacterium]